MPLFRRKTLFHVEEAMPDPEDLKLRFRRRVLLLTFVGFVTVLGIPVARDLKADLVARRSAREFAEKILETRLLASRLRAPVSLSLSDDNQSWRRLFHDLGGDCGHPGMGPDEAWISEIHWKIQVKKENGETFTGHHLCLHPTLGLLLDSVPVENGKLLVTALARENRESAFLLLGAYGAELQLVSHWN